jgi:tripeptidyl-peptidase-1
MSSKANPDLLEHRLREISTPGHSNYGKHLDVEAASQLVAPHPLASERVLSWLKDGGIHETSLQQRGEWIKFNATTAQASDLMRTKFQLYRHDGKRESDVVRTTEVNLPRSIMDDVKMIHPTTRFGMMEAQSTTIHKSVEITDASEVNRMAMDLEDGDSSCTRSITPKCLMKLYKIGGVTIYPEKAGRLGVGGFLDQFARFKDLSKFIQDTAQWVGNGTFTWEGVNGK